MLLLLLLLLFDVNEVEVDPFLSTKRISNVAGLCWTFDFGWREQILLLLMAGKPTSRDRVCPGLSVADKEISVSEGSSHKLYNQEGDLSLQGKILQLCFLDSLGWK